MYPRSSSGARGRKQIWARPALARRCSNSSRGRERFEPGPRALVHKFTRKAHSMNPQRKLAQFGVLVAALVVMANGQTAEKKTLTLQGAEQVIAAAKNEVTKLHAPGGVIAVVDDGGNLMALERLDGTFSAGANISIGKAKTAVMFKKPTRFFEELINSNGKGRTVMTALENFTPLIGGIPIVIDGQIVGGVGVSGAATADQDEKLAIAGSDAFAATTSAMSDPPAPVTYFEKS